MRIVLDANVIGPDLTLESGASWEIVNAWREDRFEVVVSDHLTSEVSTTLSKPYWRSRFPVERAERALITIRRKHPRRAHTRNRTDSDALAGRRDHCYSAIAGNADYLVTGDKELLRLKSYKTVSIVSPQEFLGDSRGSNDDQSE